MGRFGIEQVVVVDVPRGADREQAEHLGPAGFGENPVDRRGKVGRRPGAAVGIEMQGKVDEHRDGNTLGRFEADDAHFRIDWSRGPEDLFVQRRVILARIRHDRPVLHHEAAIEADAGLVSYAGRDRRRLEIRLRHDDRLGHLGWQRLDVGQAFGRAWSSTFPRYCVRNCGAV